MKKILLLTLILSTSTTLLGRSIDLSENQWRVWIDSTATYFDDELHLPPYNLNNIQTNPPTCGWESLYEREDIYITKIPATVEELVWGKNGSHYGVTGDYLGVSWFSTTINIPKEWDSKRIVLNFKSARMRAEVYLNQELVGYELINGTPFTIDISDAAKIGKENKLDVRITDPNGNYGWRDWNSFMWGKYETPPSHGFGGLTEGVTLTVTDNSYIEDVFVQNTPKLNQIITEVTLSNKGFETKGEISYTLRETGTKTVLLKKTKSISSLDSTTTIKYPITLSKAKLWSPETPNLYDLEVEWMAENGESHKLNKRVGFRWFDVKCINGDKMFFLNGKRVNLITSISWGHWPVNGIFPTKEEAVKQILAAKKLGLNMLNFHRALGQEYLFDLADELGLMIYEEPGGYMPGRSRFILKWKQEKLLRMIKRDRSHPSLVIYNMINESARNPFPSEIEDMRLAHELDPTRTITFTSSYFNKKIYDGKCPIYPATIKSHMLPNDTTLHIQGWWDEHHAEGPGTYYDDCYNSPTDFLRYKAERDEIIFYGEEGAIGTPARLELIKDEILKNPRKGWNGIQMLDNYYAFDKFIKEKGFDKAFPSVDKLTTSLATVAYYYQGRMIENVHISNNIDGWAINGWESTKMDDHSGIVDMYRNHKADPAIIAYYNQPHYVAVKARKKVISQKDSTIVDFFIVNTINMRGKYKLKVSLQDMNGNNTVQERIFDVKLLGGTNYGQLLKEAVAFTADFDGYNVIKAELMKGTKVVSKGEDLLYAPKIVAVTNNIMVADTSLVMQKMLTKAGIKYNDIKISDVPKQTNGTLVVGATIQPGLVRGFIRQDDPIIDWVLRGGTLVILKGAANWCNAYLSDKEVIDYRGSRKLPASWFGGNFFVKNHSLFDGLPQATAFNWEYQNFSRFSSHREGLRIESGECIVGCYSDHKNELFSALSELKVGRGKIIISTLDFEKGVGKDAVTNRLLTNILNY